MSGPIRIDRRTTIKWMLAATAALPDLQRRAFAAVALPPAKAYGTDPDLLRIYAPGDLWPLTFTEHERRTATALCDAIIPADGASPSASAVGVVDFLDEWISAPYVPQQQDRKLVLAGLEWLDEEAARRFGRGFAECSESQQSAICDAIYCLPKAEPRLAEAAGFFARFRDLTVGGFYTTPEGMRDIGYVGNVALAQFDGPPPEILEKVGLLEKSS